MIFDLSTLCSPVQQSTSTSTQAAPEVKYGWSWSGRPSTHDTTSLACRGTFAIHADIRTRITNNNCSILLVGVRSGVVSTSSLGTALKVVLSAETEHVIGLHAVLDEHSNADKTTEKGISFE
ncbi:hypothetical protein PRIPAC_95454 [Pristionchus pacificus]|uniref:Uncharacterized protein n=1 Tax=Pristionchus pacificus TaxID=54126 RepID=A0A2A6D2W4_PRIPA|nr:hypothetical protein PRIPAC_95454 [Pristionchus pacificus]|eukprot:PDM84784.1 hypothetical protein PRIPAC_33807 [Pristionchus pacificus]